MTPTVDDDTSTSTTTNLKKSKKLFLPIIRKLGPTELKAELARLQSELKIKSNILIRAIDNATPSYNTFAPVSLVDKEEEETLDQEDNIACMGEEEDTSTIPADEFLSQKMKLILTKKLINVPITSYYDICWAEGQNKEGQPEEEEEKHYLYGPWLTSHGKEDVIVGKWEDGQFMEDISGEQFDKRRVVTYHFIKSFSVAYVTNTQYCRLEGGDKCVISMNVQTNGVTFGDTFTVIIRWVATRVGINNLKVQVGVCVNFQKSTIFESKIRSGVMENTTPQMTDLFKTFKRACYKQLGNVGEPEEDEDEEEAKRALKEKELVEPAKPKALQTVMSTNFLLSLVILLLLFIIWKQLQQNANRQYLLLSQVKDVQTTFEVLLRDIEKLRREAKSALQTVNTILAETKN